MMFWNVLIVDVVVVDEDIFFSLVLCVIMDIVLSEVIGIISCYIVVEVYCSGNIMEFGLFFINLLVVDFVFVFYQNVLNFFCSEMMISFNLLEDCEVDLMIIDMLGQVLWVVLQMFFVGY